MCSSGHPTSPVFHRLAHDTLEGGLMAEPASCSRSLRSSTRSSALPCLYLPGNVCGQVGVFQSDCPGKPLQPASTRTFHTLHPLCWLSRMRAWYLPRLRSCVSSILSSQHTSPSGQPPVCSSWPENDVWLEAGDGKFLWKYEFSFEVNSHFPVLRTQKRLFHQRNSFTFWEIQ